MGKDYLRGMPMNENKLSIIWNVTRACCWNCKFCCVDAVYTGKKLLDDTHENELCLKEKIGIIDKLSKHNVRVDFSGGELFTDLENFMLIEYASKKLGRENIGVSISGAFLNDELIRRLSRLVHDVEITLDCKPYEFYESRPIGYHEYAAHALAELSKYDVITGAQTVITKENMSKSKINELFHWLEENKVKEWSILRFFPSGRGQKFQSITPTHLEYCKVVDYIREITKDSSIDVHFQYLLPNHEKYTLDCRAVKKSIGILPNGEVISCFWALGEKAKIDNEKFKLGNIAEQSLEEILNSKNALYWKNSCNKCVIFNKCDLEK